MSRKLTPETKDAIDKTLRIYQSPGDAASALKNLSEEDTRNAAVGFGTTAVEFGSVMSRTMGKLNPAANTVDFVNNAYNAGDEISRRGSINNATALNLGSNILGAFAVVALGGPVLGAGAVATGVGLSIAAVALGLASLTQEDGDTELYDMGEDLINAGRDFFAAMESEVTELFTDIGGNFSDGLSKFIDSVQPTAASTEDSPEYELRIFGTENASIEEYTRNDAEVLTINRDGSRTVIYPNGITDNWPLGSGMGDTPGDAETEGETPTGTPGGENPSGEGGNSAGDGFRISILGLESGLYVSNRSDGTVVVATREDAPQTLLRPDGSVELEHEDGSIEPVPQNQPEDFGADSGEGPSPVEYNHGDQSYTVYADGTVVTTQEDGTTVTAYPDSSRETTTPDGTRILKQADGTETIFNTDGTTATLTPDGSAHMTFNYGAEVVVLPDATTIYHDTQAGITTYHYPGQPSEVHYSDGAIEIINSEGEVLDRREAESGGDSEAVHGEDWTADPGDDRNPHPGPNPSPDPGPGPHPPLPPEPPLPHKVLRL